MASIPGKLSLSIGLSTKQLTNDLLKVENQLRGFDGGLSGMARQFDASFTKAKRPIEGTTMAVINFNRVIQDAPFGLMGVANNLEPMILSFQKIQRQAGGAGLAIKTLAKSAFTGPGAIITVVSLASTALLMFGDRLFKAGDKAKKAAEDMKEFGNTLGGVIGTLQGDLLSGDADQLERLNDRYNRTKQALDDLIELEDIRRDNLPQNLYKEDPITLERIKQLQQEVIKLDAQRQNLAETLSIFSVRDARAQVKTTKELEKQSEAMRRQAEDAEILFNLRRGDGGAALRQDVAIPMNVLGLGSALQPVASNLQLVTANANIAAETFATKFPQMQMQMFTLGTLSAGLADSFSTAFVDSLTGVSNFADAMKEMGNSVRDTLRQVAASLLRVIILQKLAGFFVGSLGMDQSFVNQALFGGGGGLNLTDFQRFQPGMSGANANLFLNGRQLRTQTNFTNNRATQFGF